MSVGLRLGSWKVVFFPQAFPIDGRSRQDFQRPVPSRSLIGNELVGVEGEARGPSSSLVPEESSLEEAGRNM